MTKVLIVGYGSIGNRHLENFLRFKDIQLTVYTKRNDIQLLKKKGIKVSDSLNECLKENPNIGVIANETSLHVPTAIKLAKAGLDLFAHAGHRNAELIAVFCHRTTFDLHTF